MVVYEFSGERRTWAVHVVPLLLCPTFTIGQSMEPLDRWRCTDRWQHGRSRSDVRLPTVSVGLLSSCTSSPKTIGSGPTSSHVPSRPAQRIAGCTDRVEARQIPYSTYRDFGAEHVEVDAGHHHLLGESGLVSSRTQRRGTGTSGIHAAVLSPGMGADRSNSWNDVEGDLRAIAQSPLLLGCLAPLEDHRQTCLA